MKAKPHDHVHFVRSSDSAGWMWPRAFWGGVDLREPCELIQTLSEVPLFSSLDEKGLDRISQPYLHLNSETNGQELQSQRGVEIGKGR